jgi:ADP-ribose pyrophosphatase YjhB (NUDIX family)
MGGHCEADDMSLRSAALREAQEESGIDDLVITSHPVALDRHAVLCDGRNLDHLDVQFLAIAQPDAKPRANAESRAVQWFAFDDVPRDDAAVVTLVQRARSL